MSERWTSPDLPPELIDSLGQRSESALHVEQGRRFGADSDLNE